MNEYHYITYMASHTTPRCANNIQQLTLDAAEDLRLSMIAGPRELATVAEGSRQVKYR